MSVNIDERLTLLGLALIDEAVTRKMNELRIMELEEELAKATGKVVTMTPNDETPSNQ